MPRGQRITGKDGIVQLTSGTTSEEIPCLTSFTLDVSASLSAQTSNCMLSNGDGGTDVGAEWDTQTLESRSWTFSTEHQWQRDDEIGTTEIADVTNVGDRVDIVAYPNRKDGPGNRRYFGTAIIESVSVPVEAGGVITQSISYTGDGPLQKDVTT